MNTDKFLIVVDGSYWLYYVLFGSVYEFQRKHPDEASVLIKPTDQCDQENLPNLLNSMTYTRILKQFVMKRLETINYIAKSNFQNELDMASRIDIIFAMDDRLKHNFRLDLYPEYKAQRTLVKRQYQIQPIKDYIVDVLFKELDIEDNYGYKLIKVEGAEGDDVIATALLKFKENYIDVMLIASDRDYMQIDGIHQFDLFGKKIERTLGESTVTAEEFLLGKILMGDKSDNIKQVFSKCGPKTALKLVKDKETLKNMLKNDQIAANRFALNKKIIAFSEIPTELSNKILTKLNETLYRNEILNKDINLKDFMLL